MSELPDPVRPPSPPAEQPYVPPLADIPLSRPSVPPPPTEAEDAEVPEFTRPAPVAGPIYGYGAANPPPDDTAEPVPEPAAERRPIHYEELVAGNPQQVSEEVISRYDPVDVKVHDVTFNRVSVINNELVVKVPQDGQPFRLEALTREKAVLELLDAVEVPQVRLPRLVDFSTDPAYLVATFVPGRVMADHEIRALPDGAREMLGRDIGRYILNQAVAVDPEAVRTRVPELVEGSWNLTFTSLVDAFSHPDFPSLSQQAETLYASWQEYRAQLGDQPLHFIHGDLAPRNFAVDEDNRLAGVFDFARATVGDASGEVNTLLNVDQTLFRACVDELEAGGMPVDLATVGLWRALKDLQILTYGVMNHNMQYPTFIKTRDIVARRYPNLDWSELYHD